MSKIRFSVRARRVLHLIVGTALVAGLYNNCSPNAPLKGEIYDSASTAGLGSNPAANYSACESDLRTAFENTYRPFLTRAGSCVLCHTESGPSPIHFASPNSAVGFDAFMKVGPDRVDANAISSSHAQGITGSSLQSDITAIHGSWDPAFSTYKKCLSYSSVTVENTDVLSMTDKLSPTLYFSDRATVRLTWDLQSSDALPMSARIPAVFTVDARVNYNSSGVAIGYVFSNPSLRMTTGESEAEVEGVVVRVNGQRVSGGEAFLSARKTARGIDPTVLYSGSIQVPLSSVSSADRISIGLGYVDLRARTDNPPIPPRPVLSIANTYVRTPDVGLAISGDSTARRWCVTTSPQTPTSTAVACPGFETSTTTTGWLTARPTTFNITSAGLLPTSGQNVTIYVWVANSDLKISTAAATGTISFDTTPPASPVLNSVTLGTTQVADLNLADHAESVQWCAMESSSPGNVTAGNCSPFTSAKPSFIGLKAGGNRYVGVFVRDRAGNLAASAVRTVNNVYGQITFSKLMTSSLGAQGLFANQCVSCHSNTANLAAQTAWNPSGANGYSNTVSKKDAILRSISNSTAPMPQSGLMSPKDQELIRLWFTQTKTPVEL